jgi:hypothetical protein
MADITPSSGDRAVVVHRHGVLTWISLAFNALILLLIFAGIVCHHRHHYQHGGWGDHCERQDWGRGHGDFDRRDFGALHRDWQNRDGGPQDEDRGPGGGDQRGFGLEEHHDWGNGKPGFGGPGFGGPGFGGQTSSGSFKPGTPPSAEVMTDRFMLILADKLSLTDQECAQIRPILQGQIAQFQKDMEAQKAAHQKMIDDAKTKIRAALTADQQKQFDQLTAGFGTSTPTTTDKPASK